MHGRTRMTARPKILIVEDNADARRLYAIGLNQHGFEVKLAANGAEAIVRIEAEKPDLIVLDLFMPIMNGWEVLEKINPSSDANSIPVIVVTGHSREDSQREHHSITAWLSKPVSIDQLVATIDQCFDGTPARETSGDAVRLRDHH